MSEDITVTERKSDARLNVPSMGTPFLSIILPAYNAEQYLAQCLDSILDQEFSDFEVLCVDDGSSDRTGLILDEYARFDSRVKVFHTENYGVSHARNFALSRASGDYVGFVDSDDWIDSDHFSILTRRFNDPEVDLVMCKLKFEPMDVNYKRRSIESSRSYTVRELSRKGTFEAIFCDSDFLGYCHCKVFKREKIKNFFDEKIALAEDALFCCQYACEIEKAMTVDCRTYHYRCVCDSSSNWLLKNPRRISGLRALLIIIGLLSQDEELAKYRFCEMRSLLNWYFALFSHYWKVRNQEALASLREYKPEIRKCLCSYWTSRYDGVVAKLKITLKVCFPKFWGTLRHILALDGNSSRKP